VLPFLLIFGVYDLTFERFALPLIPLLAVAAACAAQMIADRLPQALRSPKFAPVLALIVLVLPSPPRGSSEGLRKEPDTFEIAATWLRERALPTNDKVLILQNFDLPIPYSSVALRALPQSQSLYWTQAQRTLRDVSKDEPGLHVVRQQPAIVDDEGEELEPSEPVTRRNRRRAAGDLRDPTTLDHQSPSSARPETRAADLTFGEPQLREGAEFDLGFSLTERHRVPAAAHGLSARVEIFEL
jgi:hypothetical protein